MIHWLNRRSKILLLLICIIILAILGLFAILECCAQSASPVTHAAVLANHKSLSNLAGYDHLLKANEQLPSIPLSDIIPSEESFFFAETSGRSKLEAKELCSIESAAKHHPSQDIYVLLTSQTLDWSSPSSALKYYANVNFRHVDLESFVLRTPLELIWKSGQVAQSQHLASHLSDILRYLILYHFGGIWMDMDQIVIRPFPDKPNFFGQENDFAIAGGIIHLQRGHPVLAPLLLELATSFDGRIYQANGPPMVTRVLRRFCGVSAAAAATPSASARRPLKEDATMLDPDRCMGIRVLPPDAFYPITWKNWHWLFDKDKTDEVMDLITSSSSPKTFSVHIWGKQSREQEFKSVKSGEAYSLLAKEHCPHIYQAFHGVH